MKARFLGAMGVLAAGLTAGAMLTGAGSPAPAPAAAALPAEASKYKVDPVHSTNVFKITHLGVSPFYGRFDKISGEFSWDKAAGTGSFNVDIDAASVNSNNPARDKHLNSGDFFNTKEFPKITFKSTGVTKSGDGFEIAGDLTLVGKTKPVKAMAKFGGEKDAGPQMGGVKAGFDITFTIKRSDFGVSYGVENGALGDEVQVMLGLEGAKQ
jgi:polyisoprenoid-binding protein YceI